MRKNQGFSAILPLIILLIGLVVALFLVGRQTIFRNRAAETGETGPQPTYKACELHACVVKVGIGTNNCNLDTDCNRAPSASFTIQQKPPGSNQVIFINQSTDPEGDPLTFVWDFGDGSKQSSESNPTHVFPYIGSLAKIYTVKLTAIDNYFSQSTFTTSLEVYRTFKKKP